MHSAVRRFAIFLGIAILGGTSVTFSQTASSTRAAGTFDVKIAPLTLADPSADKALGRMSLDKQYHGDLEGSAKGEMLTGMAGSVKDSGSYVAIEKVTGALHGRRGTFLLRHTGTMTRGAQDLNIAVIPDSGTDQLVGLSGKMTITITDGRHFYGFDYSIAPSR